MKLYSIRWQILLPTLLILIIGFVGLYLFISDTILQLQTQTVENFLTQQIELLDADLEKHWSDPTTCEELDTHIQGWAVQINARVSLIASDGSLLSDSSSPDLITPSQNKIEFQQAEEAGQTVISKIDQSTNPPTLTISTPVTVNNETVSVIRIIYPLQEIENSIAAVRKSLWISAIVIASLTALPLIYQTSLHGNRLDRILGAVHQISEGNRDVKIESSLKDEVGTLTEEINSLARNLREEFRLMQNEQAKLNAVLTQMNDGVIILDDNGVIILANQAVQRIFNFSMVSLEGLRFVRVIRNHHIVDLWEEFQETGEDQASFLELPASSKSIQIYLTPLGPNLPGYSLFYFQDLTRMRRLEIVRRDFISNISHELRTPLASLKALSDTLQISILDDPDASDRFLKRMDTEIDALTQMVSELLELSRIEAGQVSIDISPTDANKILSQAYDRLIIQAERGQLNLELHLHDNPAIILVDGSKIEQILVNIIHNAIKFTPAGGKIKCAVTVKNQEVTFSIIDNGQGISSEDLPRVFERFYKSKKQNQNAGTGLGLSIAKHLTEANGGRIWVESKYGEGASFFISFNESGLSD